MIAVQEISNAGVRDDAASSLHERHHHRPDQRDPHLRNIRRGARKRSGDQAGGQLHSLLLHRFRSLPRSLATARFKIRHRFFARCCFERLADLAEAIF